MMLLDLSSFLFAGHLWTDKKPIESMYGIITYIYHKHEPNVGKYTIHGSYGKSSSYLFIKGVFEQLGTNRALQKLPVPSDLPT